MDEKPTKRGGPLYWLKRRSRLFWIAVVVLLPMLYVASFGPAVSLSFHGRADWLPIGVIYRPIFIVAAHHMESNIVLRRYIHLCGVSDRYEPGMTESGIAFWIRVGPAMRRR